MYYNGQCVRNSNGVIFQSDEKSGFMVSTKSNITHLTERVAQKVNLEDHQVV
jgi:sugar lactone lactonase YvrE